MTDLAANVAAEMATWQVGKQSRPLLKRTDFVVVAVSGGPDSMALLHLLSRSGLHDPAKLIVAHVNHHLRAAADADAAYVADMARRWGLIHHIEEVDVKALAQREGRSEEEAGRVARYRFFAALCRQYRCHFVATGHNADDQVETVLHHLLRGTGPAGLAAMSPVAKLPESHDWPSFILRPLLNSEAHLIRSYCAAHSLAPRVDSTNLDIDYRRNQIRNRLLPQLEQYNPRVRRRILSLASMARQDEQLMSDLVETLWHSVYECEGRGWLRLNWQGWQSQRLTMRRRLLRVAVEKLTGSTRNLGFESLEQAARVLAVWQLGKQSHLAGDLVLELAGTSLLLRRPDYDPHELWPQLQTESAITLALPGRAALGAGWEIRADLLTDTSDDWLYSRDPMEAFVALPAGPTMLQIRAPLISDRFRLGGGGSQSLGKYFSQRRIPERMRASWPLVTAGDIVWVVGHEVDRAAFASVDSDRVVHLRCQRMANS